MVKGKCIPWGRARDRHGYGVVYDNHFHKGRVVRAHRYVWEAFHGEIPESMCLLHNCDNPACIRPDHMRLGTMKDNTHDAMRKGRWKNPPRNEHLKGENAPWSKLTLAQVNEIRSLRGQVKQRELAERFGVGATQISRIQTNKRWVNQDMKQNKEGN